MINDEIESGAQPVSAEVVAQSIRELLERYDFDLVKALAAYRAGGDRVEQYGGVPPDAKPYVSRIVHQYNIKKMQQERVRTSAGR